MQKRPLQSGYSDPLLYPGFSQGNEDVPPAGGGYFPTPADVEDFSDSYVGPPSPAYFDYGTAAPSQAFLVAPGYAGAAQAPGQDYFIPDLDGPSAGPSFWQGATTAATAFGAVAFGDAEHLNVLPGNTAALPQSIAVGAGRLAGSATALQHAMAHGPLGQLKTPILIGGFGFSVGGRVTRCNKTRIELQYPQTPGEPYALVLRGQVGRDVVVGVGASSHGITLSAYGGRGHASMVGFKKFISLQEAQLLMPAVKLTAHGAKKLKLGDMPYQVQQLLEVPDIGEIAWGAGAGTELEFTKIDRLVRGGQLGSAVLKLNVSDDVEGQFLVHLEKPAQDVVDITLVPLEFARTQGTLGNMAAQVGTGHVHSGGCSVSYRFQLTMQPPGRLYNQALAALLECSTLPEPRNLPPDVTFLRGEEMSQSRGFASASVLSGYLGVCASRSSSSWWDGVDEELQTTNQVDVTRMGAVHTDCWSVDARFIRTRPDPACRKFVAMELVCRLALKGDHSHAFKDPLQREHAGRDLAHRQNQQIRDHLQNAFDMVQFPQQQTFLDASPMTLEISCLLHADDCVALTRADLARQVADGQGNDWDETGFHQLVAGADPGQHAVAQQATKIYKILKHQHNWPVIRDALRQLGRQLDVKVRVICQAYTDAHIAAEEVAALALPLVDPFDAQAVLIRLRIIASARKALEKALAQAVGDACSRQFCPNEFYAGIAEWEAALSELDSSLLAQPDDFLRTLMMSKQHHHLFRHHQDSFYRAAGICQRAAFLVDAADDARLSQWIRDMEAELTDLQQRGNAGVVPGYVLDNRKRAYQAAAQALLGGSPNWHDHADRHAIVAQLHALNGRIGALQPAAAWYSSAQPDASGASLAVPPPYIAAPNSANYPPSAAGCYDDTALPNGKDYDASSSPMTRPSDWDWQAGTSANPDGNFVPEPGLGNGLGCTPYQQSGEPEFY